MSPYLVGLLYLVFLLGLIGGGVWIAIAVCAVGIAGLYLIEASYIPVIGVLLWESWDSFVLTAVPLFIFMGEILIHSQTSSRFYSALTPFIRWLPGRLVQTNLAFCGIFSALTGASITAVAAVGSISLQDMLKRGYDKQLTLGSIAAGGTLGILIPPSIPMIIYGAMVEESVPKLFMAGLIPGIVLLLMFMAYVAIRSTVQSGLIPPVAREALSLKQKLLALRDLLPFITLVLVTLLGIYGGVMTPTEAAAVGASGALLIGVGFRSLTWEGVRLSLKATVKVSSMVLFLVAAAQIMSFSLVIVDVPRQIAAALTSLPIPTLGIMLMIIVFYILLGCVLDTISMMVVTLPVIFPAIVALGFNPIWFAVVLVILLEMALLTPPVAMNLFVLKNISGETIDDIIKGMWPYLLIMVTLIVLLFIFPDLALWLPGQMMKR